MEKGKKFDKMYLVEALPVTKTTSTGTLTYFSLEPLEVGQLIEAPIRKSVSLAVVTRLDDAKDSKANIKNAGYALRKLTKKNALNSRLAPETVRAVALIAEYYASSAGAVLATCLPKFLRDNPTLIGRYSKNPLEEDAGIKLEPLVLQIEREERFSQYRSLIRQSFAKGYSTLFVCPSHEDAVQASKELSRGIEDYVFLTSSGSGKKALETAWQEARDLEHPVVLVTTPATGFAFWRKDLKTMILDRENSQAYRTLRRPYLNWKKAYEILASVADRDLVLGDSVLSIETLWKERQGHYSELSPVKWRLPAGPTTLVDMKNPGEVISKSTGQEEDIRIRFELFSSELKALIKHALEERVGILLLGARKGLSPTTLCGDCGSILSCTVCRAPVVLHKKPARPNQPGGHKGGKSENIYICHRCGASRDPLTTCDECGGWKLVPLGIGTELIAKEAHKLFPLARVNILDKEHASTKTKARKIAKEFKDRGGILVGTELALYHVPEADYTGLVSADALFSLPDFGAEERVFYLVSRLREMCTQESVIQTRNIGKRVLTWASQGNILDFFKKEIEEREAFAYPPFTLFIKVDSPDVRSLKNQFGKWAPEFTKESMIIRLKRQDWPDEELSRELSLLPISFSIKVEPESLL